MTGYYHGNSNFAFSAKGVAGVYTIGPIVGNGDVTYLPADFTTATRRMLFVDIGKGSPNYTVRVFYPNQPTAAPDVLSSDFINWYTAVNPQFTNHNFPGAVSMAFSESGGTLDCINVSWNNVQAPCHICDLAVAKIA